MKKIYFLLIAFVMASNTLFAQATNTWTRKADYGWNAPNSNIYGRQYSVSFTINGKGYTGLGKSTNNTPLNDFWQYDTLTNVWTQMASYPGSGNITNTGFAIGNKGYVGLGKNSNSINFNDFYEFIPAINTWTQKRNFPGTARSEASSFVIGNYGYVGGGYGSSFLFDFWRYDPVNDTFIQKASITGVSSIRCIGFTVGNNGFVGYNTNGLMEYNPTMNAWFTKANCPVNYNRNSVSIANSSCGYIVDGSNNFYAYYPATNTWVQKTNYPGTANSAIPIFGIGHRIYCGTTTGNDFHAYDTITNTWSRLRGIGGLTNYDYTSAGFSIGNKGYMGGINGYEFWSYDKQVDAWSQIANLPDTLYFPVSFSIGNKGYVGTGSNYLFTAYKNTFYEYSPLTNSWTQKANFPGAGRYQAVGFSIGSKGYIGTGQNGSNAFNDFYEYNPSTNTWTQKANFPGAVRYNAAGFSIGNNGFIGTGLGSSNFSDFYEYNVPTNTWTQIPNLPSTGRYSSTGFSFKGKGYVVGGVNNSSFYMNSYSETWQYDTLTYAWTQKSNYPLQVYCASSFVIGGKGYVGLGTTLISNTVTPLANFYEYNAENEVAIDSIKGTYCAGGQIRVPFSADSAFFSSLDTFKVQLSNSAGSFASGTVIIGSKTGMGGKDTITCTIPSNTTTSSSYKVRIISAINGYISNDNGNGFTILLNQTPAVSISTGSTNFCQGTAVTFTASPTYGGTAPAYNFKVNGSSMQSGSSNTYTSSTLTNNAIVNCIITSNYTCLSTPTATSNNDTMHYITHTAPSVSIATPNTTVCAGSNVTFTATPTNGGTAQAYNFKVNGVSKQSGSSNTFATTTLTNNAVVTCMLTGTYTCGTDSATSSGITMTITPNVIPTVHVTANPSGSVCPGTTVNFSAAITNGGSTPVYAWKVNHGATVSTTNTYSSSTLANNDVVSCTITSNATCASPTVVKDSITMAINATTAPSVTISSTATGATICNGTSVTFTATPTNGGTTPTYQWYVNTTAVGTGATYTTSSLTTGAVVKCVMTSNAPCITTTTANSNIISYTVTNPVAPTLSIAASSTTICQGDLFHVNFNYTNAGSNPSFNILVNGSSTNTINGLQSGTNLAGLNNGDVVSVTLNSNASCASPSSVTSNSLTITVIPKVNPTVTLVVSPGTLINYGANIAFTAAASNAGTSPTFDFYVNGVQVQSGANPIYTNNTLHNNDQVYCVVNGNSACVVSSNVANSNTITMTVIGGPSGINAIPAIERMNIVPNPCSTCEIVIETAVDKNNLIITDLLDRTIAAQLEKTSKGYLINMPNANAGVYFIRNTKTGQVVKFVKE